MAAESDDIDFGNVQQYSYPASMAGAQMWIAWVLDQDRKIPVAPWENPDWADKFVPHKDPEMWTDLDTARDWVDKLSHHDFGLACYLPGPDASEVTDEYDVTVEELPDLPRVGLIDFDNVRHPETGEIHPVAREWIRRFDTFTEISPSGTGLHGLGAFTLPDGYKAVEVELDTDGWPLEDPHIEIYEGRRYTTMTGNRIHDLPDDVTDTDEAVRELIEEFGVDPKNTPGPEAITGDGEREPSEYEPTYEKDELAEMDKTADRQAVWDAIMQLHPTDLRLKSDQTEGDRAGPGRKSFDPSWETSESGTRLGFEDGYFIYRRGDIGLTAAHVVALEERIIHHPDEKLSGDKFDQAVAALRDRGADIPVYDPTMGAYTAMLGADQINRMEREQDDVDAHRRLADRRDIGYPTVEDVRDRTQQAIFDAMAEEKQQVIRSQTGAGKSHTVRETPWLAKDHLTGNQPVIHAAKTRKARAENAEASRKAGLDVKELKGRTELCPLASGACDPGEDGTDAEFKVENRPVSEYIEFRCNELGHAYSSVHVEIEEKIEEKDDGPIPCEADDTKCPSKTRFEDIPRTDDGDPAYDVIHCTHPFIHVPSMRMHTNVVYDERPDFSVDFNPKQMKESVGKFLEWSALPMDSYHELMMAAEVGTVHGPQMSVSMESRERVPIDSPGVIAPAVRDASPEVVLSALEDRKGILLKVHGPDCDPGEYEDHEVMDAVEEVDDRMLAGAINVRKFISRALSQTPDRQWYESNWKVHATAPAVAHALWEAREAAGEYQSARIQFEPPRLDATATDDAGWNREEVAVVFDADHDPVAMWSIPDIDRSRSVIGLDATATKSDPVWGLNTKKGIDVEFTLDRGEEALYRRYARGLRTVQVGDNLNPVTTDTYLDGNLGRRIDAVVGRIRQQFGERFRTAITSKRAKAHVRSSMEAAGVDDPDMMHYGNEESRNDFAGEKVGYVAGAIDPGDDAILLTCAALGYDVEAATKTCPNCEGGGRVDADGIDGEVTCPICDGTGEIRERGRTFRGVSADSARKVLASVREHHIAQSVGRWARQAKKDKDHAVVFVHTNASPDGLIDAKVPGAVWMPNENQREVLEAVRDASSSVTVSELYEQLGGSKRTIRRTLNAAAERGGVECAKGAGSYGANLYEAETGAELLSDVEIGNLRTEDIEDQYMWTVRIEAHMRRALTTSPLPEEENIDQMSLAAYEPAIIGSTPRL